MQGIKRRPLFVASVALALLAVVIAALSACSRGERTTVRVGFLPNLTHAVPMVGEALGSYRDARGEPVELAPFNAGPKAIEALLAGDLDFAYVGPGPAINAFVRTDGNVRVLAGAASGGAAFVVRKELRIGGPADLRHSVLATPQIGNSQDIALRRWLWEHDIVPRDRGGTVTVLPMSNSDILSMFRTKELHGAWVPEPWATRLVLETDGRVFLDESSVWPDGRFPTTLLVTRDEVLRDRPGDVAAMVAANRRIVQWISRNPARARALVNERLEHHVGKPLPPETIAAAWKRLSFTTDPMREALVENARAARRIGYLPSSDVRGLVVAPAEYAGPETRGTGAAAPPSRSDQDSP